jgi:hypothetical protein
MSGGQTLQSALLNPLEPQFSVWCDVQKIGISIRGFNLFM